MQRTQIRLMASATVIGIIAMASISEGAVVCELWTKCWTCTDNNDARDGGCMWDSSSNVCSASHDPASASVIETFSDCPSFTSYQASERACRATAESGGVMDMDTDCGTGANFDCIGSTCRNLLQCLSNIERDHRKEICRTNSTTGLIITCHEATYTRECEEAYPTCSSLCEAGAGTLSLSLALLAPLGMLAVSTLTKSL